MLWSFPECDAVLNSSVSREGDCDTLPVRLPTGASTWPAWSQPIK